MDHTNQDDLRRLARAWFSELREQRVQDDAEFDAWFNEQRRKERRLWSWRRLGGRRSAYASNDNDGPGDAA